MRSFPLRRLGAIAASGVLALAIGGCAGSGESAIVTGSPDGTGVFTPAGSVPTTAAVSTPTSGVTTTSMRAASGTLSTAGLDKVKFGMTVDEAGKALGVTLTGDQANPSCYTVHGADGPDGVSFTVADGKVERVDIENPGIATRSGAKVGSSAAEVRSLYGAQIQEQARGDGQPGAALVYVPKDAGDAQFRLVFLTDGSTVTAMRAGRQPVVLAATGCR